MKIWILKPREDLPDNDNPWRPWYGKVFGFVVAAKNEAEAREIATLESGNESVSRGDGRKPWLDKKYSTCKELKAGAKPGLILQDYRSE